MIELSYHAATKVLEQSTTLLNWLKKFALVPRESGASAHGGRGDFLLYAGFQTGHQNGPLYHRG